MVQYFPVITGSLVVQGSVLITGSINTTAGITGSFSGTATTAQTASSVANLNQNVQITGSLTTSGTITAQTLNVQQVTSSIVFSSGSNVFGNSVSNTQQFTGSVLTTGSFTVTTTGTEFQVTNTGVRLGNALTDVHPITGSVLVTGSMGIGTPSPGAPLDVWRNGTNGLVASFTDGISSNLQIQTTVSGTLLTPTTNTYVALGSNNAERMRISSSSFGFGLTTPTTFFEVFNNSTTNLAYYTTSGSANRMIVGTRNVGNFALVDIRAHGSTYTETILGNSMSNAVGVVGAPASTASMVVGTTTNNPLVFGTNNQEVMRITGSFVGIGVNPSNLFQTKDAGIASTNTYFGTGQVRIGGGSDHTTNTVLSVAPGLIQFDAPGIAGGRFFVNSSGNVGIGTTDATHKLVLANSATEVGIRLTDGTNNTYFALANSANQFGNGTSAGDTVVRGTNGISFCANNGSTTQMRISNTGAISTSSTLSVGGNASMARFYANCAFSSYTPDGLFNAASLYCSISTPGAADRIRLGYNDYGSGQYWGRIGFNATTNWSLGIVGGAGNDFSIGTGYQGSQLYIYSNGNYAFSGSNVSDKRAKANINYIRTNQLDTILKLKPVTFNKIINEEISENVHTGFIAQDIMEEGIPNLVMGSEEGGYGLDYDGVLALAVKAIQELSAKVDQQQAEINELKNRTI